MCQNLELEISLSLSLSAPRSSKFRGTQKIQRMSSSLTVYHSLKVYNSHSSRIPFSLDRIQFCVTLCSTLPLPLAPSLFSPTRRIWRAYKWSQCFFRYYKILFQSSFFMVYSQSLTVSTWLKNSRTQNDRHHVRRRRGQFSTNDA